MNKKTIIISAIVVLVILYIKNEQKRKRATSSDAEPLVASSTQETKEMNYYSGDKDFSTTGIHFYKVDWLKNTFNYLVMMDGESMQGTYQVDGENANNKGSFSCANGWRCNYKKVHTRNNQTVAIFYIENPTSDYMERRSVNFTKREIER